MKQTRWTTVGLRGVLVVLASLGPAAFPAAVMGYASLQDLANILVLPGAAGLLLAWAALRRCGLGDISSAIAKGALAGAVATLALEAVRYTGFRLGFMPGNLPELMGVLLLNRFALGPSPASTLAGFAYHFWNGACFGVILAVLVASRSRWWAIPYAFGIGIGFLLSPVVQALGVGLFGKDFGWHFAATVLLAHLAFGVVLGGVFGALRNRSRNVVPADLCSYCRAA
jgi:hypothetical protein